jgi:hypothetical protein
MVTWSALSAFSGAYSNLVQSHLTCQILVHLRLKRDPCLSTAKRGHHKGLNYLLVHLQKPPHPTNIQSYLF